MGIFHICGDECMTIAEIAYQVADYMKLDRSLIHPTTTEEMNESTPRPRFSGMSIDKARTMLGYRPQKLKEILANWDKLIREEHITTFTTTYLVPDIPFSLFIAYLFENMQ